MDSKQKWLQEEKLDRSLRKELENMTKEEERDAFYRELAFGTAGIRGIVGAGSNRMNIYTLRKANHGYAQYLLQTQKAPYKVVIAYDTRHNSRDFAIESARVLASYGIRSLIFSQPTPTPELSFAVRNLNASGGIVVTASHNPPQYNGYKVYDETGCQLTPDKITIIQEAIAKAPSPFTMKLKTIGALEKAGTVKFITERFDELYAQAVLGVQVQPALKKKIKIVYTPLHGTGGRMATKLLQSLGYEAYFVAEQMLGDGDFTTVKSPNPEEPKALALACALGKEVGADLIVANDPDADRIGIAIPEGNGYRYLTGNETGALLIDYKARFKPPVNGVLFDTVVTSPLGAIIARRHNIEVVSTLTGFKYIGSAAKKLVGTDKNFFFGYEESYGYIVDDITRDKDGMQGMVILAEMTNYYALQGKTLSDALEEVYRTYGYVASKTDNMYFTGEAGAKEMQKIMDYFRKLTLADLKPDVVAIEDYLLSRRLGQNAGELTLPKENVLKFFLKDGGFFILRPSGTEPKLKIYYITLGKDRKASDAALVNIGIKVAKMITEARK